MDGAYVLPSIDTFTNLLDKLGLIDRLKSRLLNDPHAANEKLAEVIEVLVSDSRTLRNALEQLASLKFDNNDEIAKSEQILRSILAGDLALELRNGRISCKKIVPIYRKYLNGWFSRLFKNEGATIAYLDILFERDLPDTDDDILRAIQELHTFAVEYAVDINRLMKSGDLNGARNRVKSFGDATIAQRKKLNDDLLKLTQLYTEFMTKSLAV